MEEARVQEEQTGHKPQSLIFAFIFLPSPHHLEQDRGTITPGAGVSWNPNLMLPFYFWSDFSSYSNSHSLSIFFKIEKTAPPIWRVVFKTKWRNTGRVLQNCVWGRALHQYWLFFTSVDPFQSIINLDITLPTKVRLVKAVVFLVVMYGCERWTVKKVEKCGVREDSWQSLGLQEIQPVHPKGDQSWVFIGRTDVEAETPIL